jgi:3-phosphoshikimate 1-carboxyvinyltransferase
MELRQVLAQKIHKTLSLPASKSYLNRLLILAALDQKKNHIANYSPSQDVLDLISALKKVGLLIEQVGNELILSNSFPECEKKAPADLSLELGEGGTTSRFLIALLCLGQKSYRLNVSGKLNERPFLELFNILKQLGASIESEGESLFPLHVKGPIQIPKELKVSTKETTQYLSALMLALSKHNVVFDYETHQSALYVELTKKLVQLSRNGLYEAAPDFSSLAFPACLAMMKGEIHVSNLFEIDSFQADSSLLPLLKKLGAQFEFTENGFSMKGVETYSGFELDAKDCLDLIPALAFLASYAHSASLFKNVRFLSNKESDRLEEIMKLLREFHVDHAYDSLKDELVILGNAPRVEFKQIETAPDHRMVMTAYLFLRHNQGGILSHPECVKKSFPSFFECME